MSLIVTAILFSVLLITIGNCDNQGLVNIEGSHQLSLYNNHLYNNDLSDQFLCNFPWARKKNNSCNDTGDNCECGDSLYETVFCQLNTSNANRSRLGILQNSCMTYDKSKNRTIVGHCLYQFVSTSTPIDGVFHEIPTRNASPLTFTHNFCKQWNRKGRLCGKCEEGYYPPVYSYSLSCVPCGSGSQWYSWIRFVIEAYLLLTIFLVIVTIFSISATSPQLSAFVLLCQNYAAPLNVKVMLSISKKSGASYFAKIIASLYGFWNLDFFRTLFPPICLHHMTILEISILEYAVAFYPLILLIVIYISIEMKVHERRGISSLWVKLHSAMSRIRQKWSLRSSIIDAFATFIILSYNKLLSVAFDTLMFTRTHDAKGHTMGYYLYSDASIRYFNTTHQPYAIVSVLVVFVFIALPVALLLIYPLKCWQSCLTCFRLRFELLRAFMDSFQGCYKDGTNGTWDCRYFAAVYPIVRILLFLLFSVTLTGLFYSIAAIVFIVLAMLVVIVRPYKDRYAKYNRIDAILILLQAMVCASVLCINFAEIKGRKYLKFSILLTGFIGCLPLFYISAVVIYRLYKRKFFHAFIRCLRATIKIRAFRRQNEQRELLGNADPSYGTFD